MRSVILSLFVIAAVAAAQDERTFTESSPFLVETLRDS